MTSTFGMISVAARPQQPHRSEREARDAGWSCRRSTRATDLMTIRDDLALSHYLSGLFEKSRWTIASARTCAEGIACLEDNRTAVESARPVSLTGPGGMRRPRSDPFPMLHRWW